MSIQTPSLDRLSAERHKTEIIHEFLEHVATEHDFVLTKRVSPGYVSIGGSGDRSPVDEMDMDEYVLLNQGERSYAGFKDSDSIRLPIEVYQEFHMLYKRANGKEDHRQAKALVEEHGLLYDPEFYDDIGFEGPRIDKLLYEFIGVDPNKLDDERRALLDSLGGG